MDYSKFLKKHSLKQGDLIRIKYEKIEFEGFVLPSPEKDTLVLKGKTGYNAGFLASKINEVKKLESNARIGKPMKKKIKIAKDLPTISILHTGGTIASRVNYSTGGVTAGFEAEDLLTMFPELETVANFRCSLVSNMMSEDMNFSDYEKLAKAVEKEIKAGTKGIIIGHGTDTIGYTAAALSFIFENLPVPVLIVGAQRSSDRGSSDAAMNLGCAAEFIKQTDFCGVGICMHETTHDTSCVILSGTKTRKMHSSRRDAFKPINTIPIARIYYNSKEIEYLKTDYSKKSKEKFSVNPKMESKVGIIRTYTNFDCKIFEFFEKQKYKGLILEGTGIGQAPINTKENQKTEKALKKLIDSGCVVAVTTQCINGIVHPHIYTNCRKLENIGTVFCKDMITETAYVKLAWLLANNKKQAKELLTKNLRGELTDRLLHSTFGE